MADLQSPYVDPDAPPGEVERLSPEPAAPPKVTSKAEVDALAPGSEFLDPNGVKRVKPYVVKDADTMRSVPDGGHFIADGDPTRQTRVKPTFEPLDFGTQILIDMARDNPEQIEKILKGEGGGNVRREPLTGDFYLEKDGKYYKPNRGSVVRRGLAKTAAEALPAILGTGGAVVAGTAAAPSGPGAFVAGAAGGAGGAIAGEAFNQLILAAAGYPVPPVQAMKDQALSGAGALAGQGIGEGVVQGAGALAKGFGKVKGTDFGGMLAKFLGAQPAETVRAGRLADKGVKVPPSAWLKESPYLATVVEQFDPMFRKQNVLQQSADAYYNQEVARILKAAGLDVPSTPFTDASSPVRVEPFGTVMLQSATKQAAARDKKLNDAIEAARAQVMARTSQIDPKARDASVQALRVAAQEAQTAAQALIDTGFQAIDADVKNAIKMAEADGNPGDLVRLANTKIVALRRAVGARAKLMYDNADKTAGDLAPDVTPIVGKAQEFLDALPEGFEGKYPAIVREIRRLAEPPPPAADDQGSQLAALLGHDAGSKFTPPTFGQMHMLRSMIRQDIDFNDLTPSMREGVLRQLDQSITGVLFDKEAPPALQQAAQLLREADGFYAKNIPKFKAESLRWTRQQLEAGVPVDPTELAAKYLQPGQGEEIAMVRKVIGKPLWSAVQAADTQAMLNASKTMVPGEIDGALFAKQVLDRERSGILASAYDPKTAATLREQARQVLRMQGKLPMDVRDGDTLGVLMRRAADLNAEAERLAAADPVKLLSREMRQFNQGVGDIRRQAIKSNRQSPLYFLENGTVGAIHAADKILKTPDLILAVARQFGEGSAEFEMLRQLWTQRLFQRTLGHTPRLQTELGEKIPAEVQELLMPGVTMTDAQQLARDMAFLLPPGGGEDMGGTLAGKARVLNPLSSSPNFIAKGIGHLPGANTIGRYILGKYYSTMSWAVTHPAFVRYVSAGLRSDDLAVRNFARKEFQRSFYNWLAERSGAVGAGVGAAASPDDVPTSEPGVPPQVKPFKTWRELQQGRR